MPEYTVTVEAKGYGDPLDDGEAFVAAVGGLGFDPDPATGLDEAKGMLMVAFTLDTTDARTAHDDALELWEAAWEAAFPDMAPPQVFAVRATPVAVTA